MVRGSVIVQAVVIAVVLTTSGYDAGLSVADQPETVSTGIRVLMGGVPFVVAGLAWLCFWAYPLRGQDVPPADDAAADGDEPRDAEVLSH
ncbi:hypothetical protein D3C74_476560 [compost metagenome]